MELQHWFGAQILLVAALLVAISLPNKVNGCNLDSDIVENGNLDIIGSFPCSQEYLIGSYFNNHNSLLDSDFYSFLAEEFGSSDLCKELPKSISVFRKSVLHWHLYGEGSHRHVVSTIRFDVQLNVTQWYDTHFCELVIIERLPIGVFADPFELQHLVHRRVFRNAAVFGDTNLELPSILSNRSIVELHIDIHHCISLKQCEIVIGLPLHARYPPLDAGGYATVKLGTPDMFMRCRARVVQQEACIWTLGKLGAKSGNSAIWQIPCGSELHARVVSSITCVTALICAFLIVLWTIYFSEDNDINGS